jgi:hypothetical protein
MTSFLLDSPFECCRLAWALTLILNLGNGVLSTGIPPTYGPLMLNKATNGLSGSVSVMEETSRWNPLEVHVPFTCRNVF